MRLDAPRLVPVPGGVRATARVTWEGPTHGPDVLWFEAEAASAADFDAVPEAFVLGLGPVAASLGEPRLAIDAPLCPRFVSGLRGALRALAQAEPACRELPIEPAGGLRAQVPRSPRRAAVLLSGGVDSLSALRENQRAFPPDHPASIRDGVLLHGCNEHDFTGATFDEARRRSKAEQRARLAGLCDRNGWGLVVATSNVRTFYPSFALSFRVGFGSTMAAMAFGFRRRWSDLWVGSHGLGPGSSVAGSHEWVDPQFSSSAIEVHYAEANRPRSDKLRTVAAWDDGLDVLQACLQHDVLPPGVVNCCACEKCLRTMLALEALGRLDRATTFHHRPLTPALVREAYRPPTVMHAAFAPVLAADLQARGRDDLAAAVRAQAARASRRFRRRRWRARLRRVFRDPAMGDPATRDPA